MWLMRENLSLQQVTREAIQEYQDFYSFLPLMISGAGQQNHAIIRMETFVKGLSNSSVKLNL